MHVPAISTKRVSSAGAREDTNSRASAKRRFTHTVVNMAPALLEKFKKDATDAGVDASMRIVMERSDRKALTELSCGTFAQGTGTGTAGDV